MDYFKKIKKLLRYTTRYKTQLVTILAITFIGMLVGLLQPWIFGKVIDILTKGAYNQVVLFIILMCVAELVSSLVTYLSTHLMAKVGIKVSTELKTNFYNNMIMLSSSKFDNMQSGNLLSRYESDIDNLSDFLTTHFVNFVMNFFSTLIILYFLLTINVALTLIVILFIPISLFIERYFSGKLKNKIKKLRGMNDEYLTLFNETIKGINEIKHLRQERFFKSKMQRFQMVFMQSLIKLDAIRNSGNFLKKAIFVLLEIAMLIIGIKYMQNGLLTIGSLIAFSNYAGKLNNAVSTIVRVYGSFNETTVYIDRIEEINTTLELDNRADINSSVDSTIFEGIIGFESVDFHYNESSLVFDNLNLSFFPKQLNIILGDSGLGKSTIFKLMLRLYEQQRGYILFNGTPSNQISPSSIRKNVAYAPHNPYFFNVSISENIRYANPNLKDEEIWGILKRVNLYNFIKSLPNELETLMQEAGGNFSEGQKQRLNIARSIAKSPEIYLLDEPTSALDIENRQDILKIIHQLSQDNTVIMITHDRDVLSYFKSSNIIEIDKMIKRSS